MPESLEQRLERLQSTYTEKSDKKAAEVIHSPKTEESAMSVPKKPSSSGKSARTIQRNAETILKEYAASVGIEQYELFPGKEYPTYFTRLPLFQPIKRTTARKYQAELTKTSDFIPLISKWDQGGVYKSGPPLTTEDEDTLIGILQMRKIGFQGNAQLMPGKKKSAAHLNTSREIKIHATYCVISELECLIQGKSAPPNGWGGRTIKERRDSIERLGAQILKFTKSKGLDDYVGKEFQMMEVDWIGDKRDACYYIQFHPMVVSWLEGYRTYIDLNIRRQLAPLGKALHRILSSQVSNRTWSKNFDDVLDAIGYKGRVSDAKKSALIQLAKMVKLGTLADASIDGNGRNKPFVLNVRFRDTPATPINKIPDSI